MADAVPNDAFPNDARLRLMYPLKLPHPSPTLSAQLAEIHRRILDRLPAVDRLACVIHDADTDMLKTFINSTRVGDPIAGYEFKLADSASLSRLAAGQDIRIIDDIPAEIHPGSTHSRWLIEQGYQSSFTAVLRDQGKFFGFLFADSLQKAAFTLETQRDLLLFTTLINMAISSELAAIRSITASVEVAKDLANLRDFETGAHLERMARNSHLIAKQVALRRGLNDEFVEHVYFFAPLHDIGKIGIPDDILLKPGKLSADEQIIMRTHVEKGVRIIEKILGDFNVTELPNSTILRNIVLCHHEFLDGSGYPQGLKGDQIPLEARVVTVADIFDALMHTRPYKQPWTYEQALAELRRMVAAGKLDHDCVEALHDAKAEIASVLSQYAG